MFRRSVGLSLWILVAHLGVIAGRSECAYAHADAPASEHQHHHGQNTPTPTPAHQNGCDTVAACAMTFDMDAKIASWFVHVPHDRVIVDAVTAPVLPVRAPETPPPRA